MVCCMGNISITSSMHRDQESLVRSREGMCISATRLPSFACTCPHCPTQHNSIFAFSTHLGIAHRRYALEYAYKEFVKQLKEHAKNNL